MSWVKEKLAKAITDSQQLDVTKTSCYTIEPDSPLGTRSTPAPGSAPIQNYAIEARTISVTKQVNRINGELVVSQPKTQNSVRTLAIPQQAINLLITEHQKHPSNPYMFPSPKTGTMYDPDAFRRIHDRILKDIGAEHVWFHDMRHFSPLCPSKAV